VFVLQGTLQAAFPATVLREDDFVELDVLFEDPDRTLERRTGQDPIVDWDPASDARSFISAPQDLPAQADRTVLVIANLPGVELAEIAVAGAAGPHSIANAALVAAFKTRWKSGAGEWASGNRIAGEGDRINRINKIQRADPLPEHPPRPASRPSRAPTV
jgi:hypothetical protein